MALELVQIKPDLMTLGVEVLVPECQCESAARTIADCFKFRSRIGMDVALESLTLGLKKGIKANEMWSYCKLLRVSKFILLYLEALA